MDNFKQTNHKEFVPKEQGDLLKEALNYNTAEYVKSVKAIVEAYYPDNLITSVTNTIIFRDDGHGYVEDVKVTYSAEVKKVTTETLTGSLNLNNARYWGFLNK